MSNLNSLKMMIAVTLFVGAIWLASGCNSNDTTSDRAGASATTHPTMAAIVDPASQKGGAQLWAENCARCHNLRPPQYYSDAQWDLIVHHMRVRANLTGTEAREITKFLQASN